MRLAGFIVMLLFTAVAFSDTPAYARSDTFPPVDVAFDDAIIRAWVSKYAPKTMEITPDTVDKHLEKVRPYFMQSGFDDFSTAMKESRLFESITKMQISSRLRMDAPPKILKEGLDKSGAYVWYVSVPVTVLYEGSKALPPVEALLELRIDRQVTRGLAIGIWILAQRDMAAKQGPSGE